MSTSPKKLEKSSIGSVSSWIPSVWNTPLKNQERVLSIIAEVDICLSNGDYAVEAKAKPKTEDIEDHIERMKKLRAYADGHNDSRKYLGAIAGMAVSGPVKGYAFKQGFLVLVPSGERMELECSSGFIPKNGELKSGGLFAPCRTHVNPSIWLGVSLQSGLE
ncbi:hypothetical protein Holit_01435 [Hollandina sp. SP2]